MTVVLCGVGLDSTNADDVPSVNSDGTFDYIPIPESYLTTESETFGSWRLDNRSRLENRDVYASSVIEEIKPVNSGNPVSDNRVIETHPLHRDPNFDELTYCDRYGYDGSALINLSHGDIVGFYTGLGVRDEDGIRRKERFIIGYFGVDSVIDLRGLEQHEYRNKLSEYPENAHAKRLLRAGRAKHEGVDNSGERNENYALILVDGMEPSDLLDLPVQISEYDVERRGYYLTPEFTEAFKFSRARDDGTYCVDIKNPLTLEIEGSHFIDLIHDWQ